MTLKIADAPADSERIPQEFYCNECDGYFLANLNVKLQIKVTVICPNCGHNHSRVIENGIIRESFSASYDRHEEIVCLKCTYQKQPYTAKMRTFNRGKNGARNAIPLDELWIQKAASERGQV